MNEEMWNSSLDILTRYGRTWGVTFWDYYLVLFDTYIETHVFFSAIEGESKGHKTPQKGMVHLKHIYTLDKEREKLWKQLNPYHHYLNCWVSSLNMLVPIQNVGQVPRTSQSISVSLSYSRLKYRSIKHTNNVDKDIPLIFTVIKLLQFSLSMRKNKLLCCSTRSRHIIYLQYLSSVQVTLSTEEVFTSLRRRDIAHGLFNNTRHSWYAISQRVAQKKP